MQREKIKEEASSTCSLSMMASSGSSYHHNTPNLSLDDFEGNIYPAVTLPLFDCCKYRFIEVLGSLCRHDRIKLSSFDKQGLIIILRAFPVLLTKVYAFRVIEILAILKQ